MALRSMTACGRATHSNDIGRFTIEILSLNRKHFDLNISLPPELSCFESEIRKWIFAIVSRGQLAFRLSIEFKAAIPVIVKANLPYVRQLKSAWEAIACEVGLSPKISMSLENFTSQEGVLLYENIAFDDKELYAALENATNMALMKLVEMKELEGKALHLEISMRLAKLQELLDKVIDLAPHAIERYRNKVKIRLVELLTDLLNHRGEPLSELTKYADQVDIAREVGNYAERIDITEEVARLRAHLEHFTALLNGPAYDIGKTLEFIVQEIKREINTIGAKSLEKDIGHLVIEMKTEVERIREQIQNVE